MWAVKIQLCFYSFYDILNIILQYIQIENSYFYNDISLFLIQEINFHLTDPKPLISSVHAKSNLNELIVIFSKDALH